MELKFYLAVYVVDKLKAKLVYLVDKLKLKTGKTCLSGRQDRGFFKDLLVYVVDRYTIYSHIVPFLVLFSILFFRGILHDNNKRVCRG